MSEQLALPYPPILLECVRIGGRLRVRPLSPGFADWFVAFPRALRVEGARYSVGALRPTRRRYYRITGPIEGVKHEGLPTAAAQLLYQSM